MNDLVARYLDAVRIDDVMTHLARLTEHDRYQASLGIERAADVITTAAERLGLSDVTIERFVADGQKQWWTFNAPRAWTPTVARFEIPAADIALDHATQPFTIATYSAPASLRARIVDLRGDVRGAIVVLGATDFARPDLATKLADRGALGFITDAPSRGDHPGRIELAPDTSLFAFSVTPRQRERIAAAAGAEAHVHIDIDRSARMPVVTATLPGRSDGEIWLTSHLCHPRPGANDNASGAAALLGMAAALLARRMTFDRTIRFVWGPEFLGVASLIHHRYGRLGPNARPVAVINLDMVGEDPLQCGIPLVVERAPDWCASAITPLAEQVVEAAFAQTSADAGTWQPGPFLGYSDHALFANFSDPTWRSPAVQLWHPGDPFNHSAADTLDKVSTIEMKRATVAGAALAELLASDARGVVDMTRWCEREDAAARAAADRYRAVDATWSRRLVDHVQTQNAAMRALVDEGATAWRAPTRLARPAFVGRWPGPFNYRGLLADLEPGRRAEVVAQFTADKRNYAVLTHLAMLADSFATRDEVIDAASLALRAPIDKTAAAILWTALLESKWLGEIDDGR